MTWSPQIRARCSQKYIKHAPWETARRSRLQNQEAPTMRLHLAEGARASCCVPWASLPGCGLRGRPGQAARWVCGAFPAGRGERRVCQVCLAGLGLVTASEAGTCLTQAPPWASGAVRASDLEGVTIHVKEAFGFSGSREQGARGSGRETPAGSGTIRRARENVAHASVRQTEPRTLDSRTVLPQMLCGGSAFPRATEGGSSPGLSMHSTLLLSCSRISRACSSARSAITSGARSQLWG